MTLLHDGRRVNAVCVGGRFRPSVLHAGAPLTVHGPLRVEWEGTRFKSLSHLMVGNTLVATQVCPNPFSVNWTDSPTPTRGYTLTTSVVDGYRRYTCSGTNTINNCYFADGGRLLSSLSGLAQATAMFRAPTGRNGNNFDKNFDRPMQFNSTVARTVRTQSLPEDVTGWMLLKPPASAYTGVHINAFCGVGILPSTETADSVQDIWFASIIIGYELMRALGVVCFDGDRILYDTDLPAYMMLTPPSARGRLSDCGWGAGRMTGLIIHGQPVSRVCVDGKPAYVFSHGRKILLPGKNWFWQDKLNVYDRNGLHLKKVADTLWRITGTATASTFTMGGFGTVPAGRYRFDTGNTDPRIAVLLYGTGVVEVSPGVYDIPASNPRPNQGILVTCKVGDVFDTLLEPTMIRVS